MNFVDLPADPDRTSIRRETNGSETGDDGGRHHHRVSMGGDATDIIPEEVLESQTDRSGSVGEADGSREATVRGEFAQLQRELETKIERFDHAYDICYEDPRLVIYRLVRRKDYEYLLDYCEVDDRRIRHLLVEWMRAITDDHVAETPRFPLVVRKPAMFRSGERHAHFRLSTSAGGADGSPDAERER